MKLINIIIYVIIFNVFSLFKKKWAYHAGVASVGVAAVVFLTFGTQIFMIQTRDNRTPIRIQTTHTEHRLRVSLATTEEERAQGLMFVKSLPPYGGKLFVFEQSQSVSFWMKNMRIPIDMLFIGEDMKIKFIAPDVPPCPKGSSHCPNTLSTEPVKYVLEVAAGYAKSHLIEVGDTLILN